MLVGGQRVAQRRRLELVGPRHADGRHLKAGIGRALAGAQDGGEHLIGRARGGRVVGSGDVEHVLFYRGAVGIFAFQHDHLDRAGAIDTPSTISNTNPSKGVAGAMAWRRKEPWTH